MLATLLLITDLQTGSVNIMSFNDPLSCYNYSQRMQNKNYSLECVPAGDRAVNGITQNFHDTARLMNLVNGIIRKVTNE